MKKRVIEVPAHLRRFAKDLRREQTDAERKLWSWLRAKRLGGIKFRRQHPIGPLIGDFVCTQRKLIIELDGGQHAERRQEDMARDRHLADLGYRVLRFWNDQVFKETQVVLNVIYDALQRHDPSPLPLPPKGEGE